MEEELKGLVTNPQAQALMLFGFLGICLLAVSWDIIRESFMSRRRTRTRHRIVKGNVEALICSALERGVAQDLLTEDDREVWTKRLRKQCDLDVSIEPIFNKPYWGLDPRPPIRVLKNYLQKKWAARKEVVIKQEEDVFAKYRRKQV